MKLTHPTLQQIAAKTAERVPQQLRKPLENAVMAGNKVMHAKETRELIQNQLGQEGMSPAEKVGEGCAKLVGILWSESQGDMPLRVLIPAGIILTCHALEFLMDAGVFDEITNVEVDDAIQEYSSSFLQLLGVTPEKLQQMIQQGASQQGGAQQPQPAGMPAGPQQGV